MCGLVLSVDTARRVCTDPYALAEATTTLGDRSIVRTECSSRMYIFATIEGLVARGKPKLLEILQVEATSLCR
jgi:hypothetical protein